jgi:hypothetical protein
MAPEVWNLKNCRKTAKVETVFRASGIGGWPPISTWINSYTTPYELWKGRPANVKHFRVFGSKCYIKKEDKKIGKFDSRVDEGIFVGYSCKRKEYKCYNIRINSIVERINVKVDEIDLLKTRKEIKN